MSIKTEGDGLGRYLVMIAEKWSYFASFNIGSLL